MADVGNSLTKAFDYVWGRFLGHLEGLGDVEYFWEPVPDCWSVRQGVRRPAPRGVSRPSGVMAGSACPRCSR